MQSLTYHVGLDTREQLLWPWQLALQQSGRDHITMNYGSDCNGYRLSCLWPNAADPTNIPQSYQGMTTHLVVNE